MLRDAEELIGYSVQARDGSIGAVYDFYLDDEAWTVRALVIETGQWLPEKRVLLSPEVFAGRPDWRAKAFPVSLTLEQIRNAPEAEADRPVPWPRPAGIGQPELWPLSWSGVSFNVAASAVMAREIAKEPGVRRLRSEPAQDPRVRSMRALMGYGLRAADEAVGRLEDFILDDQAWVVRYLVAGLSRFPAAKKVLIAPDWVREVDGTRSEVRTAHRASEIRDSPPYDPSAPVNRAYEERLYDYYGRPKYWV